MNQQETADAMRTERERLASYLESVPEAAWDKASLCEGWKVRDIVAHLVGNAADVVARRLEGAGSEEYNQRQIDERADRSPAQLLEEWSEQGPLLEAGIVALDDDFWNSPYPPLGTVGQAVQRLLEDLWIHAQDIRIPLGDEPVPGPGLGATLEVLAREIPERFPRLAPEVGAVEIDADGTKHTVPIGDGTAVKVSGDPITIAFAATGRVRLDQAVADGKVSITPPPPAGFADALNIYGP